MRKIKLTPNKDIYIKYRGEWYLIWYCKACARKWHVSKLVVPRLNIWDTVASFNTKSELREFVKKRFGVEVE